MNSDADGDNESSDVGDRTPLLNNQNQTNAIQSDKRRISAGIMQQSRSSASLSSLGASLGSSLVRGSADALNDVSPIISENTESITIRQPVSYQRVNHLSRHDVRTQAQLNRYKYYNRLASGSHADLFMPNHMVPPSFFLIVPIRTESGEKQSSIITIFSIWNTMMGTSLLSMPWAIQQAGFACGISIIILLGVICLYTAHRVMNSPKALGTTKDVEFTDVCHHYLGRPGYYTAITFSALSLLGAAIVYWVLMSNFLYNTVNFIYESVNNEWNVTVITNQSYTDVVCPKGIVVPPTYAPPVTEPWNLTASMLGESVPVYEPQILVRKVRSSIYQTLAAIKNGDVLFHHIWHQTHTVPFFLLFLLAPIINFKSPTFFTKFNALGTVSVLYIVIFVSYKAYSWGFHVNFTTPGEDYTPQFHWTFTSLTGILCLALYIHNAVISITRNQKNPENNGRDLTLAFMFTAGTYLLIGALFYSSFPLPKLCIEDNLLNNMASNDVMTFIARIFLLFQMTTVFPLLMYILRVQVMDAMFGNIYPSVWHVMGLNALVISCCILFAVFMPKIGTIIRFSGALCGLVYIFALPCIVFMLQRRATASLTPGIVIFHLILILLGLANFIVQFIQ